MDDIIAELLEITFALRKERDNIPRDELADHVHNLGNQVLALTKIIRDMPAYQVHAEREEKRRIEQYWNS